MQLSPETASQPDQPVKIELASGLATRVTCVAGMVFEIEAEQPAVDPLVQDIPAPVTVPLPVPPVLAVRRYVLGANCAVTVFAPVIETVQLRSLTLVQPVQPWKIELASGAATRVTSVAGVVFGTEVEHPAVEPVVHEIPGPEMLPAPLPLGRAVRR